MTNLPEGFESIFKEGYSKEQEIQDIEEVLASLEESYPTYKDKEDFLNFLKERRKEEYKDEADAPAELNTFIFLLERYLEMLSEEKK